MPAARFHFWQKGCNCWKALLQAPAGLISPKASCCSNGSVPGDGSGAVWCPGQRLSSHIPRECFPACQESKTLLTNKMPVSRDDTSALYASKVFSGWLRAMVLVYGVDAKWRAVLWISRVFALWNVPGFSGLPTPVLVVSGTVGVAVPLCSMQDVLTCLEQHLD